MGNLGNKKYMVLRPIKYKNPKSPLYRKTIKPGDNMILSFPHLEDIDIKLLLKLRVIASASEADIAKIEKARADAEAAKKAKVNDEAKALEEAKASAMRKTLEKYGVNDGQNS